MTRKKMTRKTTTYDETVGGVTEVDVVLGRGKRFDLHPGNIAFRQIVWSFRDAYQCYKFGPDKKACAAVVVHTILDRGGRFLQPIVNADNHYIVVCFTRALEKASQCLREKVMRDPTGKSKTLRSLITKPLPSSTKRVAAMKSKKRVTFKDTTEKALTVASSFRNSFNEEDTKLVVDSIVNPSIAHGTASVKHSSYFKETYFSCDKITLDDAVESNLKNLKILADVASAKIPPPPPPQPKPLITLATLDDLYVELETLDNDLSQLLDATLSSKMWMPHSSSSQPHPTSSKGGSTGAESHLDDEMAAMEEGRVVPGVTHDLPIATSSPDVQGCLVVGAAAAAAPAGKKLLDDPHTPMTTTTNETEWPSPPILRRLSSMSLSASPMSGRSVVNCNSNSNPMFRLVNSDAGTTAATAATIIATPTSTTDTTTGTEVRAVTPTETEKAVDNATATAASAWATSSDTIGTTITAQLPEAAPIKSTEVATTATTGTTTITTEAEAAVSEMIAPVVLGCAASVGWQGPPPMPPPPSSNAAVASSSSSTSRVDDPLLMTMDDWARLLRQPLADPPSSITLPSDGYDCSDFDIVGTVDVDVDLDEFDPLLSWNAFLRDYYSANSGTNAPPPPQPQHHHHHHHYHHHHYHHYYPQHD